MGAPKHGFVDKVRKVLEAAPGVLHDIDAIELALTTEEKSPNRQSIHVSLHELTKTGEIRRIKKTEGRGSNYYWPTDPDEHQQHDLPEAAKGEIKVNLPASRRWTERYINPPSENLVIERDQVEDQKPPPAAIDRQEGGSHYKDCPIEPVQYIQANGIGFCEGNVIKYITRWKQKNGIEDLRKARHYIELLIEFEERNP